MSVLATQAFGSIFRPSLPHVVLPAVCKALPGYLLVVVAGALVFIAGAFCEVSANTIPFVGWFLAPVVSLYGLMFQGRLIGLVYLDVRDKLEWD